MAIDANRITALIDELALDAPDKDYFIKVLTDPKNEKSAVQFTGQRERHDQFTRRTQQLSDKERELERRANEQIADYARQLQEADERVRKIVSDFEKSEISRATAEARLQKVKSVYNLSDDDIPKVETKPNTPPPDAGLDIKKLLQDFKKELFTELAPELAAFPRLAAIQNEILARHQELTGKRLTREQMEELMTISQSENGPNLMTAWRQKYNIGDIEKKQERDLWTKEERQKWEDEQKAKRSEEALRQVRKTADGTARSISPVFRDYEQHVEPADRFESKPPQQQQQQTQQQQQQQHSGPKMTGAERAAKKWIERREGGIGMGKEEPQGARP